MRVDGFRLAPLQQHLRCIQASSPERAWNASLEVDVRGPLDPLELERALAQLVTRHEILRTAFPAPADGAEALQWVGAASPQPLVHADLAELSGSERAERLARLAAELDTTPFARDEPRSLRAALATLAPDEHRLFLSQPSLAADQRSLWNLVLELARELAEQPCDPEPTQFGDLAQWLHECFEGDDAATGLAYWRRIDLTAALQLRHPLEHDRGARAFAPQELVRELAGRSREAVIALARSRRLPVEALLLAAWQVLLARACERSDAVLAVASSGRAFEDLAEALGPLARFLPVSNPLDERVSFAQFARRADAARCQAEEWHDLYAPERLDAHAGATFPYSFEYIAAVPDVELGERRFSLVRRSLCAETFRLRLTVEERADALALVFAHDPRFLAEADVRVVADQLETLLAAACERPDAPALSLSLVSEAERDRLVHELGRGPEPRAEELSIPASLVERARRAPDAVAVRAEGREIRYGELVARAQRLARTLQGLGVGPGVFVGLHLGRSIEMLVAILAVLEAGGAYLPLPPEYPSGRLAFMLADSGAPLVLTRSRDAQGLPAFAGRTLAIDEAEAFAPAGATAGSPARPGDVAYAIYTSGSSGRPKGVPITRANLAASTRVRFDVYREEVGAYLLLSSFAFDSSVAGIFWTLAQGGTLVLPPEGFEREIPALAALVAEHRITHLLALPYVWSLVLEAGPAELLATLTTVIVAGESCPAELVRCHAAKLPRANLFNEYGPTECTVWSTVFDCSRPFVRAQVPIGRPIPGAEVLVVGDDGQLAPIGFAGELRVGGPGLAAGYLARSELSAERFVAHPFAPGRKLYRTGDRARFLPDGNLEFLGRADQQVKIRGHRIELEELENALLAHGSVQEAVVLAREAGGEQRLFAYVRSGASEEELKRHLARHVPESMLPARIVALASFPRLSNGKVDRNALPAPEERVAAGAEPAGALERVIGAIWCDLLGVERVARDDDFFALGGHSLLATRLFARLKDTFAVQIPLRAIFEHRTLAALAAECARDPNERERIERTAEIALAVIELSDEEAEKALGA